MSKEKVNSLTIADKEGINTALTKKPHPGSGFEQLAKMRSFNYKMLILFFSAYTPYFITRIVGNQQRAIFSSSHANRATVNFIFTCVCYKTS